MHVKCTATCLRRRPILRYSDAAEEGHPKKRNPGVTAKSKIEGKPVSKLKLALFALDTYSKMAIDKAGADWMGGDVRRARAAARVVLFNQAVDGLLGRDTRPNAHRSV